MAGAVGLVRRLGLALDYPAVGADLVRLALAAGDMARARQAAAPVTEVAAGNDVPWMTGEALRCQGLIEDDPEILQAAVAPTAAGRVPCGSRWPARTRAPPSPGTASRTRPPAPRPGGRHLRAARRRP